jgi:hypothetical protein
MRPYAWLVLALVLSGCAESISPSGSVVAPATEAAPDSLLTRAPQPKRDSGGELAQAEAPGERTPAGEVKRRIIYAARVELSVEDVGKTDARLVAMVQAAGGHISGSEIIGNIGTLRSAFWTVRIPVERYESFLGEVASLGELSRRSSTSQDVTEEFYDIEARLKNKRVEEARLVKLLEEATAALKDVLDVERELARVREEIERFEGRIRYLADQTDLTTVTIHASERRQFTPAAAPGLGTRIERRFQLSLDSLRRFGENLLLGFVGLVPWLPLLAVGLGLAWWAFRRMRRGRLTRVRPTGPFTSGTQPA